MDGINSKIYDELTKFFDERYVRQETCSDNRKEAEAKIAGMSIAQERIATKLDIICKVGYAILGALITLIAASVWSIITK